MTPLYAAILILGASGSATRSMEVEGESIGGIVLQVAIGGVKDVLGSIERRDGTRREISVAELTKRLPRDYWLRIDGQPRTGWKSWCEAVVRVGAYVTDCRRDGSVGYGYRLRIRGFDDVTTSTEIRDGRVVKTFNASWTERIKIGRLTREIPIHVQISIRADETDLQSTRLVGTATGTADTRDFDCRLVRRFADKRAADELDSGLADALERIQTGGTELYQHGASDVLTIVRDAIRIGRGR
jgi:hypothetical protein